MDLSIIVPFFNAEDSIGDCIESLLSQGLDKDRYEIILLNDGSTDGGRTVVEQYSAQNENLLLVNDVNKGVYAQRNQGLKLACGRYIFFIDADDYLLNGTLGKILRFAIENELQLMGFQSKTTDERYAGKTTESKTHQSNYFIGSGASYLLEHPNTRLEIWWYLINRAYLDRIGLSFYEGYYHADVPFTMQLWTKADQVAFCPEILHRYYQSHGSIIRNSSGAGYQKRFVSSLVMFDKIKDIVAELRQENKPYTQQLTHILKMRTDQYVFFFLVGILRSQLPFSDLKKAIKKLVDAEAYPMEEYLNTHDPELKIRILTKIFNRPSLLKMCFRCYRASKKLKF